MDEIIIMIEKISNNMILMKRNIDSHYYIITTVDNRPFKETDEGNHTDIFYISLLLFNKKDGGLNFGFDIEAIDKVDQTIIESLTGFMDGFCMETLDENDNFYISYDETDPYDRYSISKKLHGLLMDYDSVEKFEEKIFSSNSKVIKSFADMSSYDMEVTLYDSEGTSIECTCTECGKSKFLTDKSFTIRKKLSYPDPISYYVGLPRIVENVYDTDDFYSVFWKEITELSLLKDKFVSIKDSFDTQNLLPMKDDLYQVHKDVSKINQDITVSYNLEFPSYNIVVDNPEIEIATAVEIGYYDFEKDQENWSILVYVGKKSGADVIAKKEFPNRYVMDHEFHQDASTKVCIIADLVANAELNTEVKNVIENITGFEASEEKEFLTGLEKLVLENIKRKRG